MLLALLACVAIATPTLSPADAKDFPSKIGPALSGPLAKLRWGMTGDEAKAAAPDLVKAMEIRMPNDVNDADAPEPWLPFAGGEIQLKVGNFGLSSIKLRYRDRAAALAALAVWKAPDRPDNAHGFEFWSSAKGGMRALLRPDDDGAVVELSPFVPLADQLGKGLVFAPGGKPLLGRARADVCLASIFDDAKPDTFVLPSSEHSSGYLAMKVSWQDEKVESYRLVVDYTYDRAVRDAIPKLLAKKLGKARTWTDPTYAVGSPTCLAFGKGKNPTIWACDGSVVGMRPISVWTIYVGEEPYL